MKKLILFSVIVFSALFSSAQSVVFPQSSNAAWKVSVNTSVTIPDTIHVVGTDTTIYQYLTGGEIRSGRMSVIINLAKISDTVSGSISIEGCNDNTGLSWARIDGYGLTNDTLIFTVATLVKKRYQFDADYLKYRLVIHISNHVAGTCKFVARTNSAWKRYYKNANLNN